MLVLSRKLNEKIVIDGGIVITVVKLDRNQVRIGIEAPGDVAVFREEIAPAPDEPEFRGGRGRVGSDAAPPRAGSSWTGGRRSVSLTTVEPS